VEGTQQRKKSGSITEREQERGKRNSSMERDTNGRERNFIFKLLREYYKQQRV
jgi:hypothetical protein